MNKKYAEVLIILRTLAVVSCTKAIDIPLPPKIVVHFSEDDSRQVQLSENDKAYIELHSWLSEHRSDWYTTSGKYPGGLYLKTGNYGIQIKETKLVLYSTKYDMPRAMYIQNIEPDELLEIRKLGK